MITRNVVCLALGCGILALAIAEIQARTFHGTTRFNRLQRLGWYGMVLNTNK